MKTLVAFFLSFLGGFAHSQTFTGKGGNLNDYAGIYARQSFKLTIIGLPTKVDSTFGLEAVLLTLHHERVSDLKITLEAPDGTSIWLTNRNGKEAGKHYIQTRFSQFGKNGRISDGKAPFTGDFVPDGRLDFINNGQNPNGVWTVLVEDLKKDIVGRLDSVQLIFSNKPASIKNNATCRCPNGEANCELLPDMVIVPLFTQNQIQEYPWNHKVYPGQLRFAASIANIGVGPLEIVGTNEWICGDQKVDTCLVCPDGSMSRLKIKQRIYSKNDEEIVSRDLSAGTMYIENLPGHNHYHVDNWVEFRLLKKEGTKSSIVAKGKKVSYCLYTTGSCYNKDGLCAIDGKNYGETMLNFGMGNYATCDYDKQGISVGGFDTYGMLYEGQFITLPKNLKTGDYFLEIEVDPNHTYLESNRSNNVFQMKFRIEKQERKEG
ncbi:lysyl oxidase family protein [Runella sp.]|uniref:lysyl oxidase family protein n=1 Tax=Runella sp. TaxID=1960881 RepID=UPI003D0991A0